MLLDQGQELLGRMRVAPLDDTQDLGEAVHLRLVVGGKCMMARIYRPLPGDARGALRGSTSIPF